MRERFRDLYIAHADKIEAVRSNCTGDLNGPYLIDPHNAFIEAKTKIVFAGQETNGWPNRDVEAQMETYRKFNLGENYRSTPFWSAVRTLELALTGSNFNSAALNLNRFSENRSDAKTKRPSKSNRTALSALDPLLLHELRMLSPDVVVFFTGPLWGYDDRLKDLLGDAWERVGGLSSRQLSRIISPHLNAAIFRMHHPGSFRGKRLFNRVMESLIAEAKSELISKDVATTKETMVVEK